MNGVVVVDKPKAMTSHDVVNRVRRILGQRSVGHLGTLDPSATGVLPIVTGNLTRLAQFYLHSEKAYEGLIRFGFATDTYDADGQATSTPLQVKLQEVEIDSLAARFRGIIRQVPPPFSAKKVGGVPAYRLARKKKEIPLEPVELEVKEFAVLGIDGDCVRFRVRVASGTYIRSIAHEMGQMLGCGAHLASLRRTHAAEFTIGDSHTLEELTTAAQQGSADSLFVHPRKLLPAMPSVTASDESAAMIRNGRAVNLPDFSRCAQIKVFHGQSELLAIATRVAGTLFHPEIVFAG